MFLICNLTTLHEEYYRWKWLSAILSQKWESCVWISWGNVDCFSTGNACVVFTLPQPTSWIVIKQRSRSSPCWDFLILCLTFYMGVHSVGNRLLSQVQQVRLFLRGWVLDYAWPGQLGQLFSAGPGASYLSPLGFLPHQKWLPKLVQCHLEYHLHPVVLRHRLNEESQVKCLAHC